MFGGPQHPKIEIIRTGREKRKSENVSECAYALSRPPPPCPLPISASIPATLSPLCFALRRQKAPGGRRRGGDSCVWSGLGGHPPVKSGEAE